MNSGLFPLYLLYTAVRKMFFTIFYIFNKLILIEFFPLKERGGANQLLEGPGAESIASMQSFSSIQLPPPQLINAPTSKPTSSAPTSRPSKKPISQQPTPAPTQSFLVAILLICKL
jgi:hypothetical protein